MQMKGFVGLDCDRLSYHQSRLSVGQLLTGYHACSIDVGGELAGIHLKRRGCHIGGLDEERCDGVTGNPGGDRDKHDKPDPPAK